MQAAAAQVANRRDRSRLLFLTVGEHAPGGSAGGAELGFVGPQADPRVLALYYQAADVSVHAATAETFGLAIAEALACGTPVVASDVGGIPEVIDDGDTGFLVPPGDSTTMANRIAELLEDEGKRRRMGAKAVETARSRLGLDLQAKAYLEWYSDILEGLGKRDVAVSPLRMSS